MQILLLVVVGLGVLVSLVGGIMLLVAAFRQSVLWGLASLFLPFASFVFVAMHWGAARKGFLLGLIGLALMVAPLFGATELRETMMKTAQSRLPVPPAAEAKTPAAPVLDATAKIAALRAKIEQLEAQFAQTSAPLSLRYQSLAATRKALIPGDAAAVARFNEEAAAYQQQTAAQRRLQQELTAARGELENQLAERAKAAAGSPAPSAAARPVIMYSTASCPACVMAKLYFQKKGVPFETRDVQQSPAFAEEFRKMGGRGVPLILVGAKRVDGFNAQAIDAAML